MHNPDFSPYNYLHDADDPPQLNVGWLDSTRPYAQGTPPDGLLDRLWIFCRESVNVMRGVYECELCTEPGFGAHTTRWRGTMVRFGRDPHVRR